MTDSKVSDFEKAAESFPWHKQGDSLFMAGDDWWNNACLYLYHDNWDVYATGYKRAADVLVEHVNDTQSNQDILVYPVVFLYRQYLELRLKKSIIMDGNQLLDLSSAKPLSHHRINELWKDCRSIPEGPITDLDNVGECIAQLSAKDTSSFVFRYPLSKDGKPSITDLRLINLRNLSEVLARTASLFDSCGMALSGYLDDK